MKNKKLRKQTNRKKDVDRLKGAVILCKDNKFSNIMPVLSQFKFRKSFVESAILKGYITQEDKKLLYKNNLVKLSNGRPATLKSKKDMAFWIAYPNIYNRIGKEIDMRSALLKAYGYKIKWSVVKNAN
ncbi:MAG: hypothetical protein WC549_01950 [Actinomycetota bacterium]